MRLYIPHSFTQQTFIFLGTRNTVVYKTEDKNLCHRAQFLISDDKEDMAVLIMILNSLVFHLMQGGIKLYSLELGWSIELNESDAV